MTLFTKDFLEELNEEFEEFGRIEIVMDFCDVSFKEAVLRIANYCDIEPRYIEKTKKPCKGCVMCEELEKTYHNPTM